MKYCLSFLSAILTVYLIACNNSGQTSKAENDIDAARDFIRAALDGKFDIARNYMLQDSSNMQYLDAVERNYVKMDPVTKSNYLSSSITIHLVNPLNDSTTIVIYSNSFKNDKDTLKVLKINNGWLVDLKYLFTHDMDTSYNNINRIDSLK